MARKRSYGEGAIIEHPDGRFQAQLRLQNGARRCKTFASRREATAWLAEERVKAGQGLLAADDKLTVAAYLEQWRRSHLATLRRGSADLYGRMLDLHLLPRIGPLPLAKLQPARVAALYADLRAAGVGAATIRLCHAVLHRALRQAVEWGLVPRNVADAVKPPRHTPRQMRVLDPAEAARLLAAARGDQLEAFYHLCLLGGLRCGEALAVRWEDVDWRAGAVQVRRQAQWARGRGVVYSEPKTASGRRVVPLPEPTLALLRARREGRAAEPAAVAATRRGHELVTCWPNGAPVTPSQARRAWTLLRDHLGWPGLRLHDLRHTYATMLLAAGVHPRVAQERLGHSSVSMTLGVYSHVLPSVHAEATRRLTELVFGAECQQDASSEAATGAEGAEEPPAEGDDPGAPPVAARKG